MNYGQICIHVWEFVNILMATPTIENLSYRTGRLAINPNIVELLFNWYLILSSDVVFPVSAEAAWKYSTWNCTVFTLLDYPDFLDYPDWPLTTLTEVFPCFSSVVWQMPGLNSQSQGTDRISSELLSFVLYLSLCYAIVFMLFCCYYVVLLLCCSVIICVVLYIDYVYCTTDTGC